MSAFELIAIALITAVVSRHVEAQQVGSCSMTEYFGKMEGCNTGFIHSLQKNPKSDCSVELNTLQDCAVKKLASCFSNQNLNDAMLKLVFKSFVTKELFCDKAGIQFPSVEGNATLPCNLTISEYTSKINDCSRTVLNMWVANRADKRTCGEYVKTKKCVKKVIDDHNCIPEGLFKEMINVSLGKYNMFCPDGQDPVAGAASSVLPYKIFFFFVLLINIFF